MATVKTLVRMKRAGVYFPPGTVFEDFDPVEAAGLKGSVKIVDEPVLDPASEIVDPANGEAPPPAPPSVGDAPPPADSASAGGGGNDRVAEIMAAFDLLDEADWTATGKPRTKALTAVLGYHASADEVEAALKLRDAM